MSTMASNKRVKLQCLVLGAAGAGKTSILRRYFHHSFAEGQRNPTLGSDFYTGRVTHPSGEDIVINLQMWDTPGRERYYLKRQRQRAGASLKESFFRQADAIMLVYDMTSSTSFTQLLRWYADLMELQKHRPLPILIVGNKLDLFEADLQRATTVVHPRRVAQRDVLGLSGAFRGNDFRYEYRVSPVKSTQSSPNNRRMEISSYLANRENWTTDGSYLESLLNSEDASHPDREMVLLWCMRNGLQHVEVSAATGNRVDVAMKALIDLAMAAKDCADDGEDPPMNTNLLRNEKLDIHRRYNAEGDRCSFFRPISRMLRTVAPNTTE